MIGTETWAVVAATGRPSPSRLDGSEGRTPPLHRIPWKDLVASIHRTTVALAPAEQERLGELEVATDALLHALAVALPPQTFLEVVAVPPFLNDAPVRVRVEALKRGGFRVASRVLPRHEGCSPFFRILAGRLRTAVALLGGEPSEYRAKCSALRGDYSVPTPRVHDRGDRPAVRSVPSEERAVTIAAQAIDEQRPTRNLVLPLQRSHGLTRAEARVAERLAAGMTVPSIAASLGISVDTVRSHLKRAYAKMGVRRQAELVRVVLGRP